MYYANLTDQAVKNINRFKHLSTFEVENYVENSYNNDESFQDFLGNCDGTMCSNLYDEDNDVTIFTELDQDSEEIKVLGVKKGDVRF